MRLLEGVRTQKYEPLILYDLHIFTTLRMYAKHNFSEMYANVSSRSEKDIILSVVSFVGG
jgi:hypothetical protein